MGAVTSTLFAAVGASVPASGAGGFSAAMSAATGASGSPAASTVADPFGRMGTDLQSLVRIGGASSSVKDISATAASANSTALSQGHTRHHGAHAKISSGDLATDFANATIG